MSIDTDPILASFISVAQTVLSGLISESGPIAGPTTPSVIKQGQVGVRPDFPYVQLDLTNSSDTSGYLLAVSTDDNDDVVYDTHKKFMLQYMVYGGNAGAIAETLATSFRRDSILLQICQETDGQVEQVFAVNTISRSLSTEKYDVASFELTYNINDREVDTDIGTFDTISLTGELKQHEDDEDPLIMEIDVP